MLGVNALYHLQYPALKPRTGLLTLACLPTCLPARYPSKIRVLLVSPHITGQYAYDLRAKSASSSLCCNAK